GVSWAENRRACRTWWRLPGPLLAAVAQTTTKPPSGKTPTFGLDCTVWVLTLTWICGPSICVAEIGAAKPTRNAVQARRAGAAETAGRRVLMVSPLVRQPEHHSLSPMPRLSMPSRDCREQG